MLKTAIVADDAYTQHLTGRFHPERPARYTTIVQALTKVGLQTPENTILPRMANPEEIALCHSPDYIQLVEKECQETIESGIIEGTAMLSTGDVSICPSSYEIARLAVGGVLEGVDAVMTDRFPRVFCVVRPPGHHACPNKGMGFCLFNNIAIGARYAQRKHGVGRVLIIDWDVHHGNGTQDIFEADPSVFYFSTHQQGIYPGTGAKEEIGFGNVMNCPILGGENSRKEVLQAFEELLPEAMSNFQPELVMISAGFDAHVLDPLGGFNLSDEDFATLTKYVMQIANRYAKGRIVSVLEGGYSLQALASGTVAHVNALA